jgi:hypothetical protein
MDKQPGPLPDPRQKVVFRVEQDVYESLAAMKAETGMSPDDTAGLLLHKLVRNPSGMVALLEALLPAKAAAAAAPIDLASRREVS